MTNAQNELREYLGNKWEPDWTVWNNERLRKELKGYADGWDFYRRSKYAVYLLAHVSISEWRRPYLTFVREVAPPGLVLEYHAGVGGFGLQLYDGWGYEPAFADFQTKATPFLKWRLRQRELKADLYDLEKDDLLHYPLVICFDALERYEPEQQQVLIERLAVLGKKVIINATRDSFVEPGRYHPVNISALLDQIGDRMIKHKIVNVYVNLIAFSGSEEA
jgi:hypothetical protein